MRGVAAEDRKEREARRIPGTKMRGVAAEDRGEREARCLREAREERV